MTIHDADLREFSRYAMREIAFHKQQENARRYGFSEEITKSYARLREINCKMLFDATRREGVVWL